MAVYKNDANLQGLWLLNNDLADYTPNNNDLTNNNGVTFNSSDKQEGSHSGDFERGSSQSGSITHAAQTGLNLGAIGSFCFWTKPESVGSNMGIIVKYLPTGNQRSYIIRFETSGRMGVLFSGNGAAITQAVADSTLSAGTWYHIAVVANGTDIRIYLNGNLDRAPLAYTAGFFATTADFNLGNDPPGAFYDGLLDEVGVFNRALSAAEVLDIFTNGIQDPPSNVGAPVILDNNPIFEGIVIR